MSGGVALGSGLVEMAMGPWGTSKNSTRAFEMRPQQTQSSKLGNKNIQKHVPKKHGKPHAYSSCYFFLWGVGHPKQWSIVEGGEIKPSKVRNFRVLLSQLWQKNPNISGSGILLEKNNYPARSAISDHEV